MSVAARPIFSERRVFTPALVFVQGRFAPDQVAKVLRRRPVFGLGSLLELLSEKLRYFGAEPRLL